MLLVGAAGAYLGAYLQEKGKNVATKEDIEKITDTVESVRRQHQEVLESMKAGHQFRLVAVERRLQAHQEGFRLWRKLTMVSGDQDLQRRRAVVAECTEWWEQNCFYLGPRSRVAFFSAYMTVHITRAAHNQEDADKLQRAWEEIIAPGKILQEEVALPPLAGPEWDLWMTEQRTKAVSSPH